MGLEDVGIDELAEPATIAAISVIVAHICEVIMHKVLHITLRRYHKIAIVSVIFLILSAGVMAFSGLTNYESAVSPQQLKPITSPAINTTQTPLSNGTMNTTQAITPSVTPSVAPSKPSYTLLFFEQPGCHACELMKPKVDAWTKDNPRVTLRDVDITRDAATAAKYAVRATPTTIIVDAKGERLDTTVGEFDVAQLTEWLNAH